MLIYNIDITSQLGFMLFNIKQSSIQISVRLLRFADVVGQDGAVTGHVRSTCCLKLSAGPSIQSEAQSRVGKNQWQNRLEEDQGSGTDSGNSVWNQLST